MSFSLEDAQEAGQIIITTVSNGGSLIDAANIISQNSNHDIAAWGGALATITGIVFKPDTGLGSFFNTIGIAAEVVNAISEVFDGEFTVDDIAAISGVIGAILARNPATEIPAAYFILISLLPTFARWLEGSPLSDQINQFWDAARNWRPRVDPLALDLNNNGIETISADGTVLFDHNGDGIKNSTGWLESTDGWLVLDRNSDGMINSGKELFGVDTIKSNGQKATDAFDALKDLDANNDNKIDAVDAVFNLLRVWQDSNQDGISQATELTSLADQHITQINLNVEITNNNLGNGNAEVAKATFVRDDGTSSAVSALNLQSNPFYRQFPEMSISSGSKQLPDMKASGAVRDLREAAGSSYDLKAALITYSKQSTRADQLNKLDELLTAWANTSEMKTSQQSDLIHVHYLIPGLNMYTYDEPLHLEEDDSLAQLRVQLGKVLKMIDVLERFNGTLFIQAQDGNTASGVISYLRNPPNQQIINDEIYFWQLTA